MVLNLIPFLIIYFLNKDSYDYIIVINLIL